MDNSVPDAFIFMKVGDYGGECLEGILERKKRELGEGKDDFLGLRRERGSLHPTEQVQRFVERWDEGHGPIEVLMSLTQIQPKRRRLSGHGKSQGTILRRRRKVGDGAFRNLH